MSTERSPFRILVVEDDVDTLANLAAFLRSCFPLALVEAVSTVDEGREKLSQGIASGLEYALVVRDLMLPKEAGLFPELDESLCLFLRDSTPESVVVHITAYASHPSVAAHLANVHIEPGDPSAFLIDKTDVMWPERVRDKITQFMTRWPIHGSTRVMRAIEFSPEHYGAGLSILTYFGQVLSAKHPSTNARVRIEQDGHTVRLTIEAPNGEKDSIERTLEEYGLVVTGRRQPEEMFDDATSAMRLRYKLEMAQMELRFQKQLLDESRRSQASRIDSLENEVSQLLMAVREGLRAPSGADIVIGGVMRDSYQANQAGAMGPGSRAENINFVQVWNSARTQVDLDRLAADLSLLRTELKKQASEPCHDMIIGSIAAAESAAKEKDGPKTLRLLAAAGNWALETATAIGASVAADAIRHSLGL